MNAGKHQITESLRLDRWLCYARFVKSRTRAQKLIESGAIRMDGKKITTSSHIVKPGDVLTLTLLQKIKSVRVLAVSERRVSAIIAQGFYEEAAPEISLHSARSERVGARPTKRDRRMLDKLHPKSGDISSYFDKEDKI